MSLYRNKVTAERREFYYDPGVPWVKIGQPATITSISGDDDGALVFTALEAGLAVLDSQSSSSQDNQTPDFNGGGGDFGGGGSSSDW